MNKHFNKRKIFDFYKENAHINIKIFGIKITFKCPNINQLEELCCIACIDYLKAQQTVFPHPIGIVINKDITIGKNCVIYQNVTIGAGKYNDKIQSNVPHIGNGVTIFSNSVIIGGVTIGDNAIIGAGSVVIHDVPSETVVAGNPAKIVNKVEGLNR